MSPFLHKMERAFLFQLIFSGPPWWQFWALLVSINSSSFYMSGIPILLIKDVKNYHKYVLQLLNYYII